MKTFGKYMAIAGIASIVLLFLNMNLIVLMWIDLWGEATGWLIRVGLIVVGAALFFLSPADEDFDYRG